MQDRFKFRAWKKISQIYDYDIQECEKIPLHNSNKEKCFACFQSYLKNQDIFEIEQCTGLKDKNGKLIYEGDIVNCSFNGKANTVETFSKKLFQGKHLVEFFEYYFSPFNYVNASDVEVIGNIHENPELLEENND